MDPHEIFNPLDLLKLMWPEVIIYDKQREMILGVRDAVETDVVAGNKLGKDFIAGFIALSYFTWPWVYHTPEYVRNIDKNRRPGMDPHTRRVITTSVKDDHLDVLWAEIARWVTTCREELLTTQLDMVHHEIRLRSERSAKNPMSYLKGQVSAKGEGLAGHHAAYTLGIGDESSGLDNEVQEQFQGWTAKRFYFGNPNPCENFWKRNYEQGEKIGKDGRIFRRCIRISGDDSPNVILAKKMIEAGLTPTRETIVPGVLTYDEYEERLATWDPERIEVGINARWWVGPGTKLCPTFWLDEAIKFGNKLPLRRALPCYMGVDSGEGGDDTSWVIGDRLGVLDILSMKTPDTNEVYGTTLDMFRKWNVTPERTTFDLGGGGREHVHRLRAGGYQVRATGFGKAPSVEKRRGNTQFDERRNVEEDAYTYVNRRSEIYWDIRQVLERANDGAYLAKNWFGNAEGFGLPMPMCAELIRQLSPIPIRHDNEGRFKLIPKQNMNDPDDTETFRYLIGRSPDIADAFGLMLFGMTHKPIRAKAGAA